MIFKGGGDASGGGGGGNVNVTEIGGAVQGSANVVDQGNQALRVNIVAGAGAGGTSSNFGSSFPSAGTAVGAQNPTGKMAAVNVDGSGNLLVNVAVGGGASSGSTTAYQGNAPWSIVGSGGLFPISGSATVYQGTTVNDNLIAVGGSSISLGQTTMAKSIPVTVASDQALTVFNGTLDAGNSSTAILGSSGGVFTGSALNVFNQTATNVYVYSDQSSAASGVSLQFSSDGTNWHEVDAYTYTAGGNALIITTPTRAEYFRIVYTNGSVAQTVFQLQTIHKFSPAFGAITEVIDTFGTQAHVQLTKALLAAWQGSSIVALVAASGNQLVVAGSGGLYPVTGSVTVVGSGGLFPISGSATVYQGTLPWAITGSGGLFPISGSATVYQGTPPWAVTGSGGQFVVVGSGGLFPISGSATVYQGTPPWAVVGSGGQVAVIGSGGLFPVNGSVQISGSATVYQGTPPWAVTGSGGQFAVVGSGGQFAVVGSGGLFPVNGSVQINGSATVYQGTPPWAVTGSGGQFAVIGSGGLFPVTGSGGQMAVVGSGGLFPITGSGGLMNVNMVPVTGSGHLVNSLISLNTTNGSCVKSSPSSLYGWAITNTNAALRYVKLYSKGTTISVGTDTPQITLGIPGNTAGAGMLAAEYVAGITFGSGLGYAITANVPMTDSTAIGSGDIVMNLFYN